MTISNGSRNYYETRWAGSIEKAFPGLVDRVRLLVVSSEAEFEGKKAGAENSFLWHHTMRVMSHAHRLALKEKCDPLVSALTALFHDSGKFDGGVYHGEGTIEEEIAADIATRMLKEFRASVELITAVSGSLRALYREGSEKTPVSDIVHDADFLDKFGIVGAGNQLQRAALRGDTPTDFMERHISRELTYARSAPHLMLTAHGKRMALSKSRETLRFLRKYVNDFNSLGFGLFRERRHSVKRDDGKRFDLLLVSRLHCPHCGKRLTDELFFEKDVKCVKLVALTSCRMCGYENRNQFCSPEIE